MFFAVVKKISTHLINKDAAGWATPSYAGSTKTVGPTTKSIFSFGLNIQKNMIELMFGIKHADLTITAQT